MSARRSGKWLSSLGGHRGLVISVFADVIMLVLFFKSRGLFLPEGPFSRVSSLLFPIALSVIIGNKIFPLIPLPNPWAKVFPSAGNEKEGRARLVIAELFANKRNRYATTSTTILLLAIALNATQKALHVDSGLLPIITVSVLLVLLWCDQMILRYRIKRGFYGMNQFEAREFLRFLLSHTDKEDFSDQDGARAVFPPVVELLESARTAPDYAKV